MTKRHVLSKIARLYDPLGWIAPIIVTAKIYIQKLWKSGLSWDEALTESLMKEWLGFENDLAKIERIVIPRWVNTRKEDKIELHVYADASQAAYAAAVYLKSVDNNGQVCVNLVSAKTKVSPIGKEVSIPRLELCAALLGTKLIYEISHIMKISKENLYAWSDSTVVLA
ncbi:unnamed protein product [Parnassius mnemosyne]|uniref:Reverse transcriptase/retrotransposon-derived protein RNase H-like domain-containing protein n=1 Tax=Parnassius mnemosyne TaxID=213953 RepID=A0AAV1KQP9_9NEOP